MRLSDIIITVISGEAIAIIFSDLLKDNKSVFDIVKWLFLFLMPVLAIIVFWLVEKISRRFVFIIQFAKYCLVGIIVTLVDLKVFEFLIWILGSAVGAVSGLSKAVSFLVATSAKFLGNKYWTFEEREKQNMGREFFCFFIVTVIGLLVDVMAYLFFAKTIGPQLGISLMIWEKISVILAAISAAIWNFLGYKIIIFRK